MVGDTKNGRLPFPDATATIGAAALFREPGCITAHACRHQYRLVLHSSQVLSVCLDDWNIKNRQVAPQEADSVIFPRLPKYFEVDSISAN